MTEDIPVCPDCVQGKHSNCTGTSWNNTKDEETYCPCAVKNHPETWIEDEVEWDIDANLPLYTRDYLKGDADPMVGMWLRNVVGYKIGDKIYPPEDVIIIRPVK